MLISTKVVTSTQIVLNQDEIQSAIIAYISLNTEVPDNAKFVVEFEDAPNGTDLQAIVDMSGVYEKTPEPANKPVEAPKATRASRAAPKVTEPVKETAKPEVVETLVIQDAPKPNISTTPEDRTDPGVQQEAPVEEPPFEVDTTPVVEPIVETPAAEKPSSATPKIFPQTNTSAPTPPKPAEGEVDPAVKAKSLFANLQKPTN